MRAAETGGRPRAGGSADTQRLEVCICTYRRPEVLRRLLEQITICAGRLSGSVVVGVVVVDDDPERSAEAVVLDRADGPSIRYRATASGNVARARNAALDEAVEDADLLALIDDDCWPSDEWLVELLAVQERSGADVVAGACDMVLPPAAPAWLSDEPFIEELRIEPDGSTTTNAYLKNLLLRAELLRSHHLRFDERFGVTGGEDAMFLLELARRGVDIVHAANALVTERVSAERATLLWQLRRRCWYGNTESFTSIAGGTVSRRRAVARGIKCVAVAVGRPIRRVRRRQPPQLRFAAAEALRGIGRILGGLGVRLRHH